MFSFGEKYAGADGSVSEELYQDSKFRVHSVGVVQMVEAAVVMLAGEDSSPLAGILKDLGTRHVSYGVLPAHYSVVGTALLTVLENALGGGWTPEVRDGWISVYQLVADGMQA